MSSENLVLNGNFERELADWKTEGQVEAASVRGKTAALFNGRDRAVQEVGRSDDGGGHLGPGTYSCSFRATQVGELNGLAKVDIHRWDGGNLFVGDVSASVPLGPDTTDWIAKTLEFYIVHEKSSATLFLSCQSADPEKNQSEHRGIAITDVELVKKA